MRTSTDVASLIAKLNPREMSPNTVHPSATSPKRFLRILYADDAPELRDIARISFSRDGHGIECVADGLFALNRVMADPAFDLIITDHRMPNLNGLELVTRLRELCFPGKIMVFSSGLSTEVAATYKRLKVDRVLFKPVFPSKLLEVLRELFPNAARAPQSVPPVDIPLRRPPPRHG